MLPSSFIGEYGSDARNCLGRTMKTTVVFLASSVALTLAFYMLADYLLPGPAPSTPMVVLFAGIAMVIVWLTRCVVHSIRQGRTKKDSAPTTLLLVILCTALAMHLSACSKAAAPPASAPASAPEASSAPGASSMPRVTGTALLESNKKEEAGYGLYSYVLLSHPPSDAEVPRYQAFFKALLALPEASQLGKYVSKDRINVTYVPVTSAPSGWEQFSLDKRVDSVMSNYDYARGAVILAALSQATGQGPVIISVLQPLNVSSHPRPVLVQDLSKAQATLMQSYVAEFVSQAAQDHFWQPNTLQSFALTLRNGLETAASGLGMSQAAVSSWVKFFK